MLEPVVPVEISAPEAAMGDITGDLAARRGQVLGTDNGLASQRLIRGLAPLSELAGYQTRLNAMTSGEGRYAIALSHFEAVPPTVQQQLVASLKVHDDD